MKRTQDLSLKDFDLFARCIEAAAAKTIDENTKCYSIPVFRVNRVEKTLKVRYKYVSTYKQRYDWTFDNEEGMIANNNELINMKTFYVLYKLFALHFLDDDSLLDEIWDWVPLWESARSNIDKLYKIKANFLGANCSGNNHSNSELEGTYLYKVKWVTHKSETRPDFTRVLYQQERISLTRYSLMYQLLYKDVGLSSGKVMGILQKIDEKIDDYVKRRLYRQ